MRCEWCNTRQLECEMEEFRNHQTCCEYCAAEENAHSGYYD
jgi:hypothetical protein